MPIGNKAEYVPAKINLSGQNWLTADEDVIILKPGAPLTNIRYNSAGWDRSKNRCTPEGSAIYIAPIPEEFIYSPDTWEGLTPNASTAILMPDGKMIDEFGQVWGFEFEGNGTSNGWKRDYKKIIENLYVVDNNSSTSIGGGGNPLVPLAEPLKA